jgi:membrane-associated HD superfamily phosphohydrolase
MLSRRLDRVAAFTRRDAVRLGVASLLLITGLTVVLSIDDLPQAVDLAPGDLATVDVSAPRTLAFASAIETEAARQAARDVVPPQYDYKAETAAALTRRQLDALAALRASRAALPPN